MSKIVKFIRSALNNSSANEAAQALKMAAATMQKEGINPASLLQEKGIDHTAELEILRSEVALYQSAEKSAKALYESARTELAYLRRKGSGVSPAELREAKETAIRWHNKAIDMEHSKETWHKTALTLKEREEEANEIAAKYQAQANETWEKFEKYKSRFIGGGTVILLCVIAAAYHTASGQIDNAYSKGFNAGKWDAVTRADHKDPTAPEQSARDDGTATCVIQGLTYNTETKKSVHTKFQYQGGKVTTFENGKATGTDLETSREHFLNQVNRYWASKANCKLGILS